jgi:hypothetical protein
MESRPRRTRCSFSLSVPSLLPFSPRSEAKRSYVPVSWRYHVSEHPLTGPSRLASISYPSVFQSDCHHLDDISMTLVHNLAYMSSGPHITYSTSCQAGLSRASTPPPTPSSPSSSSQPRRPRPRTKVTTELEAALRLLTCLEDTASGPVGRDQISGIQLPRRFAVHHPPCRGLVCES